MTAVVANIATSTSGSSVNSATCNLPALTAAGEVLLGCVGFKSGGVNTQWPTGWTVIFDSGPTDSRASTNYHQAAWAWKVADASDITAGSVTVQLEPTGTATAYPCFTLRRLPGADPTNPINAFAGGVSTANVNKTVTWPAITPTVDNPLVLLDHANADSSQTPPYWSAYPAGYTQDFAIVARTATNGSELGGFENVPVTAANTPYTPPTGTFNSSQFDSIVCTIAINPRTAGVNTVQSVGAQAANNATVSATWPRATTAGSQLVAVLGHNNSRTISTVPAGWVLRDTSSGTTTAEWFVYEIENAASRSGTETFTFNLAGDLSLFLLELSGVDTTTPDDALAKFSGSSTVPTIGPLTAGANAGLAIAVGEGGQGSPSPGNPSTAGWVAVPGGYRASLAYQPISGGSSPSCTFTTSTTWAGAIFSYNAPAGSGVSVAVASSVAASLAGGKVASAPFAVTTSSVPAAAGSKVGVRAFDTTTRIAAAAAGTKATSGSFTLAGLANTNLLSGNVVTGVLDVAAHVGAAFAGAKRATGALSLSVGSAVNVAARKLTSGALDVTTRPAPLFAASRSVAGAFRTVWQAVVALVTGSTTKSTSTFQIGSPVEQFSVGDPTSRYSINGAPTDRYRIDPP